MKISKGQIGLNPKKFLEKEPVLFCINDVVQNSRTAKNGSNYKDFTLDVVGKHGEWIGDFNINFLFNRDLNALIDAFGSDTDAWKGRLILVSAEEDGEFARWKLESNNEETIST